MLGSPVQTTLASASPAAQPATVRGCSCVQEEKKPLKEGVQDMLVKHHLFSWDIDG